MKTVLVILLVVLGLAVLVSLPGCAGFEPVRTAVAVEGARAADEARKAAEWTLCDAISVGAWRRAYGADPARADGWKRLCAQPDAMPAAGPAEGAR